MDAGAFHQPPGQGGVQWRQGHGAVAEHLHQQPAGAEQDHRAELGVDAAADDQLVGARQLQHGLHGHPAEGALAVQCHDRLLHGAEGLVHRGAVTQVQLHPADIAFVGELGGEQLDHHRVAHGIGRRRRRLGTGGHVGGNRGDAVGLQHLFGFPFVQKGASLGQHPFQQRFHPPAIGVGLAGSGRFGVRNQGRGFVDGAQVVAVAPQEIEQLHGRVRVAVGGDAGGIQQALPSLHVLAPIQLASSGLVVVAARATSRSAVLVGSVMAWGVSTTSRPSLSGFSRARRMARS